MIATAIVPLLLTAAATVPPSLPPLSGQDQAVQVRLDKDGDYYPGHDAQVEVKPKYDGFLLVLHVDPEGQLRVLFPLEPFDEAFVEGGKKYELVNRGGLGSFYVGEAAGIGTVFAAHSDFPFHVNPFATDHRWDYQALWIPPETDIETALVDLVAKMSHDGWFEYDLAEYEAYGQDSYASSGPSYNIYAEPYAVCCGPAVGVSFFYGSSYYYPYGYPWYFSSYGYYPSHYYYGPYYGYRASYGYPYYRGRYHPGRRYAGGYPRGGQYRFKSPSRFDRGRSPGQYRPRVGVDASRHAFGGRRGSGGIDYRGRRSPSAGPTVSPRRRTVTPVATAGGSPTGKARPRTRPSGRVGSRRAGSPPQVADRSRATGRTPRGTPTTGRRTAGPPRSQPGRRAGVPTKRTGTPSPRKTTRPRPRGESLGRPVLKRIEPPARRRASSRPDNRRSGRTARSGRTSTPRASRPSSRSSASRASRPSRSSSRPQARSGGAGRRSAGARAPSRSQARSRGGGSRRKP